MLADLPENLITPIGIGDSELRDAVAAYLAKHTPPPLQPSSQGRIDQVDHQETLQLGILCASPPPPHATSLAMREECDVARFTVASINNRSASINRRLLSIVDDGVLTIWARIEAVEASYTACGDGSVGQALASLRAQLPEMAAVIGPACSDDLASVAGSNSTSGGPLLFLSGSSTASSLSDGAAFPRVVRLASNEQRIAAAWQQLLSTRFTSIMRIVMAHDGSAWGAAAVEEFERMCGRIGVETVTVGPMTAGAPRATLEALAEAMAPEPSGVVYLAAEPSLARALLAESCRSRMMHGKEYAWLLGWMTEEILYDEEMRYNADAACGAEGALGVAEVPDESSEGYQAFAAGWRGVASRTACLEKVAGGYCARDAAAGCPASLSDYSAATADAVALFAASADSLRDEMDAQMRNASVSALQQALRRALRNGSALYEHVGAGALRMTNWAPSGSLVLDSSDDRVGRLALRNFKRIAAAKACGCTDEAGCLAAVTVLSFKYGCSLPGEPSECAYESAEEILFPGGETQPPCTVNCSQLVGAGDGDSVIVVVVVIVIGVVLFAAMLLVLIRLYTRWRRPADSEAVIPAMTVSERQGEEEDVQEELARIDAEKEAGVCTFWFLNINEVLELTPPARQWGAPLAEDSKPKDSHNPFVSPARRDRRLPPSPGVQGRQQRHPSTSDGPMPCFQELREKGRLVPITISRTDAFLCSAINLNGDVPKTGRVLGRIRPDARVLDGVPSGDATPQMQQQSSRGPTRQEVCMTIQASHSRSQGPTPPSMLKMASASFTSPFRRCSQSVKAETAPPKQPEPELSKRYVLKEGEGKPVYAHELLVISHRWDEPKNPDPKGVQIEKVKEMLRARPELKYVWYDWCCMPQEPLRDGGELKRTRAEKAAFGYMLKNANLLYLSMRVLIILDLSSLSRFWPQFEAWLSMQEAYNEGLRPSKGKRHTITAVHEASKLGPSVMKRVLEMM